jgi:hypothetical protein
MLAAAVAILLLAEWILQPVPVAAATATLGALLATWWRPGRLPWIGAGLGAGLLAGAAHHLYVHGNGLSPAPAEGLPAHLLAETASGLAVAILATAAAVLARRFI